MKFRNTIAVAVLFVALGAYLYFVERTKIHEEGEKKTLVAVKADEVAGVKLDNPESGTEIVLKKTAAGWRIEKPIDAEADGQTVDNLVRAVAGAELKRTLEGTTDSAASYGLDKPVAIVTLTLSSGKTLPAIRVGKTSPVGFSTYVQIEGSPQIKLVPSSFYYGMKKEVKDFRNKTIVDFQDDDVQKVDVAGGDAPLELVRDGAEWKIGKPEALKADATEVRTFLSSLKSLRAQDFFDNPPSLADYGLDKPRRTIALTIGKDQTKKELLIGAEKERDKKKELYVKRGDGTTVFAVGSWVWASLDKGLSAFRDKTVLSFDPDQLSAIEVTRRDGESYRLVRKAASAPTPAATPGAAPKPVWLVDGAKSTKEPQTAQLVADLHGLKGFEIAAEKPTDLSAYGLASPEVTFSLVDAKGNPVGRVLVAQVGSGSEGGATTNTYAMAEGASVVYHVRDYQFAHLDKRRSDLAESESTGTPTAAPTAPVRPAPTEEEGD